jgi:hypothetical protein
MTFDPMAVAVDWLDAYRAADLGAILNMYADDAVTDCACDGMTVAGKKGLRAYWERRFRDYPASDLDNLQAYAEGATISYVARDRVVTATMEFNAEGQISRLRQISGKTRRAWTESDIEQFRALVGKLSTAQIAVMFNRTNAAIIQKAFDLRISLKVRDILTDETCPAK